MIDSGIEQRHSLNGEVLRSHSDMKQRWRNLQARNSRIEQEMQSVQELLSNLGEKASGSSAFGEEASTSTSSGSRRSSDSSPRKIDIGGHRRRTGDWQSLSSPGSTKGVVSSSASSRAASPFRKMTSRLKSSRDREEPPPLPTNTAIHVSPHYPVSLPSSSVHLEPHPAADRDASSTPFHAQRHSSRSRKSEITSSLTRSKSRQPHAGHTPSIPAFFDESDVTLDSTRIDRARTPNPRASLGPVSNMAIENRPRWNGSTRPVKDDFPVQPTPPAKGRVSLGSFTTPTRALSPTFSAIASGRNTPSIYSSYDTRNTKRNFTAPRLASSSSVKSTSASVTRQRPSSPNSRIPAPASAFAIPDGRAKNYAGLSSEYAEGEDNIETLFFGSFTPDEDKALSMMQRAISPTPSSYRGGEGRRQSQIPLLSVSASSVSSTPLTSPKGRRMRDASNSARSDAMTPEPHTRHRAASSSNVHSGPKKQ